MSHKITVLIFLGVFFTTKTTAQDTIFTRFSTETGTFEQQQVETEADRLFGVKVPARWMVNVHLSPYQSVLNYINSNSVSTLMAGAEYKITPAFSTGLRYSYGFQPSITNFTSNAHLHYLQLEQRWYPKMAQKIKTGAGANNLTGTYVGFRTGLQYEFQKKWIFTDELGNVYVRGGNRVDVWQAEIRYGIQRRVRKYGLFDYSAGIALNHSPNIQRGVEQSFTSLQLNQEFRIGLALFQRNKNADYSGAYCGILRCFEDNRRMFKINTLDLLKVFYYDYGQRNFGFVFNPNIAFEQKIKSSPFSLELETDLDVTNGSLNDNSNVYQGYGITGAGGIRWYYNQPKRIAAGRAGNNLSGPFVALRGAYSYNEQWFQTGQQTEQNSQSSSQGVHALWGYQLRIFKNGYTAIRVGPGMFRQKGTDQPDHWNFDVFSDLKVGFTF
jgi:hypothetical protein